ncbi:hypothetical protein Hanom_Chr10g00927121 [Helianthus anomalus]
MTSNSAESINALSKDYRKLPITQLIEFFRQSVQKWFYDRRLEGIKERHELTQWAQKKIAKKIDGSRTWTAAGVGLNTFDVDDRKKRGFVKLTAVIMLSDVIPMKCIKKHTRKRLILFLINLNGRYQKVL